MLLAVLISCAVRASGAAYFISRGSLTEYLVAVVPGAGIRGRCALSPVLEDRVLTAISLYRQKKVRKLLFSGRRDRGGYDEVNAMRCFAAARGVAPEDIFLDQAGFTTYQTMYRAGAVFKVKRCLVVTQRYHLYRALYIARKLGLDARGVVADRRMYVYQCWYTFRDFFARIKAWLQAGVFRSLPEYPGRLYPISGDGRSTHDLPATLRR